MTHSPRPTKSPCIGRDLGIRWGCTCVTTPPFLIQTHPPAGSWKGHGLGRKSSFGDDLSSMDKQYDSLSNTKDDKNSVGENLNSICELEFTSDGPWVVPYGVRYGQ